MSTANIQAQVDGRVWKVEQATDQSVSEGDIVVIVEAMKMEIPHEATATGVLRVLVNEGDLVKEGQVLATIA